MAFLKNTWYAAGWAEDFDEKPAMREIIGQHILMYRDNGLLHAMSDTCPHRFAPLHLGKRVGDGIQCGYHGLRFDAKGTCVHNPQGDGRIPRRVILRVYPVVERDKLVWIWMGESEPPDPARIPDFSFVEDSSYAVVKGATVGVGAYELYTDNILDLGHSEFLHTGLGTTAFTVSERKISQDGSTLHSAIRHGNDVPARGAQFILKKEGQRFDFWADTRWNAPASMAFHSYLGEVGKPKPKRPSIPTLHIFTPENEGMTRYLWALGRPNDFDSEHSGRIRSALVQAFESEDKPMIAAQFRRLNGKTFWDMQPLLLPTDEGPVKARRILAKLIATELNAEASTSSVDRKQ